MIYLFDEEIESVITKLKESIDKRVMVLRILAMRQMSPIPDRLELWVTISCLTGMIEKLMEDNKKLTDALELMSYRQIKEAS